MNNLTQGSPELNAELEESLPKLTDPALYWTANYVVGELPILYVKLFYRETKKTLILRRDKVTVKQLGRWQGAIHYIHQDEKRQRKQLFFTARGMAFKILRGAGL